MNTAQLPDRETIMKFTRPSNTSSTTHLAPIEKNGEPVADAPATAGKSFCQWIDITPEMAATWLKNNYGNRPVKEDVVTAYARDMVNGVWVPTHQGIAFNDEDRLIDGQHRLRAIVLANVTVRMMVTFNLPSKIDGREMTTMDCVDRGRTRSVADQLTIQHGFKYGSLTASICAALSSICCGERTRRLSVGQTLDVFRAFEKSVTFVIENRSKEHGLKSAGVLAAFSFAHAHLGKPVEEMFFYVNGLERSDKFPVISLLKAFLTSDEAKLISRSLDRGLAEMTLQVLWLEHENRKIEKLEMSLDGANWFRAQQPERVAKIAAVFKLPVKVEAPVVKRPSTVECREPAPEPVVKTKITLENILKLVEHRFQLSRLIIAGKGDVIDISNARRAFISLGLFFGHSPAEIGKLIRRTADQVKAIHIPEKNLSNGLRKTLETLKTTLSR